MENKEQRPEASRCTRRDFLERMGAASSVAALAQAAAKAVPAAPPDRADAPRASGRLFPAGLPKRAWSEFAAHGFVAPVSGVIYHPAKAPCCGAPLGGISTGCLDVNVAGVYGYSSIFNPVSPCPIAKDMRMPRKAPSFQPLLGLSVGGRTAFLTTQKIL